MRKRLCKWLYCHKLYRLAEKISPSVYWYLILQESGGAFIRGFMSGVKEGGKHGLS